MSKPEAGSKPGAGSEPGTGKDQAGGPSAGMHGEGAHAHFSHPDGSWYRLWITRSSPKTERGHPWHLHASYDKSGTVAPVAGTDWYRQEYGMADWDFDNQWSAIEAFRKRAQTRLRHGYQLKEGQVPPE